MSITVKNATDGAIMPAELAASPSKAVLDRFVRDVCENPQLWGDETASPVLDLIADCEALGSALADQCKEWRQALECLSDESKDDILMVIKRITIEMNMAIGDKF